MQELGTPNTQAQGNLSIGTVAKLTGISVHTLRAWEKRYQVVDVLRSETGRRLYSTDDVHRLRLLRKLTQSGHSIGNVARLADAQLEQMMDLEFEDSEPRQLEGDRVNVCIFSERLGEAATMNSAAAKRVNIVLETNEVGVLRETLTVKAPYNVIFVFNTILKHQLRMLRQIIENESQHRYFIVFSSSQREMIDELQSLGFNMLRAPISYQHLFDKVVESATASQSTDGNKTVSGLNFGEVQPHRFTRKQLQALANIPSSIDCECPHHIASLIQQLTMFEAYCQGCESKNRQDAVLHNNIYKVTARARNLMESAIGLVMKAEKINIEYMSAEK